MTSFFRPPSLLLRLVRRRTRVAPEGRREIFFAISSSVRVNILVAAEGKQKHS